MKSRNGCGICKSRRLKCGEERPSCSRCVRSGTQCTGYDRPLKWSTKHEQFGHPHLGWQDGRGKRKEKRILPRARLTPSGSNDTSLGNPDSYNSVLDAEISHGEDFDQSIDLDDILSLPKSSEITNSTFWPFTFTPDMVASEDELDDLNDEVITIGNDNAQDVQTLQVEDIAQSQEPIFAGSLSNEISQSQDIAPNSRSLHVLETLSINSSLVHEGLEVYQSHDTAGGASATENLQLAAKAGKSSQQSSDQLVLSKTLNDESTVLVDCYFKDIAQLFSCYDGRLNPFRTAVSKMWTTSPLLYHSLASMAASSLDHLFPQFLKLGREHRAKAIALIEMEEKFDEKALLATLMLGGTASWHNVQDTGASFFNFLVKQLRKMSQSGQFGLDNTNYRFFHEATVYWEMLLAFVVDSAELQKTGGTPAMSEPSPPRKVPHPWTGIARETQFLVQEVGRLVRQQRKRAYLHRFMTQAHIDQLRTSLSQAENLERKLLAISNSTSYQQDVVNPEDCETPLWHLYTLNEVYKCTGLIQIYRVFPDILHSRITTNGDVISLDHEQIACTRTVKHEYLVDGVPQAIASRLANEWLCRYTVNTVEMVRRIPVESGTRDFQPFILVALCSELRIQPDIASTNALAEDSTYDRTRRSQYHQQTQVVSPKLRLSLQDNLPVVRARGLIMSRLISFLHVLPPRPIRVCIDIVKTSWAKMDELAVETARKKSQHKDKTIFGSDDGGAGSPDTLSTEPTGEFEAEVIDVYWMDIMMENKWETTMA